MSVRAHLPGYGRLPFLRNAAVRTGVYIGVGFTLIFVAWLFVANRVPALEGYAFERNLAAASAFGVLALVPLIRFFRVPGNLLASSLIGWGILTLTYAVLGVHFWALGNRYTASQIFMIGAVLFTILATLAWIGTCVWRAFHPYVRRSNHDLS
jgi:hypothetical protein